MMTVLRYTLRQEKGICKLCGPFLNAVHLQQPEIRSGRRHSIWHWNLETQTIHTFLSVVQMSEPKTRARMGRHGYMEGFRPRFYLTCCPERQVFKSPATLLSAEYIRELKTAICWT